MFSIFLGLMLIFSLVFLSGIEITGDVITPSSPSDCLDIYYCANYLTPSACKANLCSVFDDSVPKNITCGKGYICDCWWNTSVNMCGPYWVALWENATCFPNCAGKECGEDGCGGICGACSFGVCNSEGKCGPSCFEQGGTICESYEICDGNILSAGDTNRCCSGKCGLPISFDWRNRHGENWNSPIRDQGQVSSCTSFGGLAPIESAINLYYNQHLDIDLSEQSTFACGKELYNVNSTDSKINLCININSPALFICNAKFSGIVDESCYPYVDYITPDTFNCVNLCSDFSNRFWKVTDFTQLVNENYLTDFALDENNNVVYGGPLLERLHQEDLTEEKLKIDLIKYGPVGASEVIPGAGHTAAIVGWTVLDYQLKDTCSDTDVCLESGCNNSCTPGEVVCRNYYSAGNINVKGIKTFCNSKGDDIDWDAGYTFCTGEEICYNKNCVSKESLTEGDSLCISENFINYPSNNYIYSPLKGRNIWIIKNSGGTSYGDKGYFYNIFNATQFNVIGVVKTPIIPPAGKSYSILCVDKDNDCFCNWGISENEPATCPNSCKPEKDWDDSNPNIGALGVGQLSPEITSECIIDEDCETNYECVNGACIKEQLIPPIIPIGENKKNMENYNDKGVFLISDSDWRDVLQLIPLTTWTGSESCNRGYGTPKNVCVYPTLIYHEEVTGFDADSIIYFMQQYNTERITIIGESPQELDNLLIAQPELGAGIASSNIKRIAPKDYINYWSSYKGVVYVQDDYELALLASTYASLIDTPLIIRGTSLDVDGNFAGRNVICVGQISGRICNEQYSLSQLQQKYIQKTNTDKIILVNPNDLTISVNEEFQPEKSSNNIHEIYSKTSLAAPILASAKHEVIISAKSSDYNSVDKFIEQKINSLQFSPEYLTIIASPNAIDMTKDNPNYPSWFSGGALREEVDNHIYGTFGANLFQDLAVGRIFSLTSSDVSGYISRDIFYDKTPHTKEFTLIWPSIFNMKVELKQLENMLDSLGYEGSTFYADEMQIDADTLVSQSQNDFLIAYGGHAWVYGWGYFDVPALKNNKIWLNSPMLVSEGCGTCAFDKASIKNELFCSEVIRRGSIGYFGATTDASATNWDPLQMFYNELFKNVNIGTAAKNVRNRAIPQAYIISNYGSGNSFGPYDTWNLLIGDPLFNPDLQLSYPYSYNLINVRGEMVNDKYILEANMPELKKNMKISSNNYETYRNYNWVEYPLGDSVNRFSTFEYADYNLSNNNLVEEGCTDQNMFVFKVNLLPNKNITSVKETIYNDINKKNLQLNYLPVYGPQDKLTLWNNLYSIKYHRASETGLYYIYLEDTLSYKDPFNSDNNKILCNETTLLARNYTITFNLEDI